MWTVPEVAFGSAAALLVTFLATAVVKLLLAKPLLLVSFTTRAADRAGGLDFLSSNVAVVAAVGSTLGDTEKSTVKRKKAKLVIGPEGIHPLAW